MGSQRAKGGELQIMGHKEDQGHDAPPVAAETKVAVVDRVDTQGTRQQADITDGDTPFNTIPSKPPHGTQRRQRKIHLTPRRERRERKLIDKGSNNLEG